MKMKLAEIAKAIDAQDINAAWDELEVTSVAFDSRNLTPGSLFVPLQGARDGHEFVAQAFQNGAKATLWAADHDIPSDDQFPRLVVKDPLAAFQRLSQYYLKKINPIVVAVTGSNGKTTTKDMIAAILATQFNVTKTFANFNNEIGVPVTLLNMEPSTEVVVVEMGMDRFDQLDLLSRLATPDYAVITMIGEAHIEFFGTRDRIADAKMEIVHGMNEDGTLIINGDEPLLTARAADIEQQVVTFGRQLADDFYATSVQLADDQVAFSVNEWPDLTFTLPMVGEYNVNNALAAIAVGAQLQITPENMQKALQDLQMTENRAEWIQGTNGERILSDVYNSNPTAVAEVLKTMEQVQTEGKKVIVLGDMLELGIASAQLHAQLAAEIDPDQIAEVYLVGDEMQALLKQLTADGFPNQRLHHYAKNELAQLTKDLNATLRTDDIVLLKGSHGIHLETVLQGLTKE